MRFDGGKPRLSASDLANHLGCRHLTQLDLLAAKGSLRPPVWRDPILEVLQQRGFEHESAYLDHLRRDGVSVVEAKAEGGSGFDATVRAMRAGADVIVQATVASGDWFGRADVLRRVEHPSALGGWSYEVVDTKLARETRAGTILQLALYSEIVGEVQGAMPEHMHVVSPGTGFQPETFRLADYLAYHRFVKRRLVDAVREAPEATYPEPVAQCDVCRWWSACDKERRDDDHLSFVAGLSKLQRRELADWGITTLAQLAREPLPLTRRPSRGSPHSYVRAREQARVQLQAREEKRPVYELLPLAAERGLARLPEPSPGDIFFDIEGDAYVGTSGLEYLLGFVTVEGDGNPRYHSQWAVDAPEERQAFEAFVDDVMARWEQYPNLHIYHFAPYEPSAMKRLMGRYATREDEVDRMLRAKLFVDLHSITKQAIRAGIERYSIKDLEQFYGYEREVELREASKNLRAFERALELGEVDVVPADVREAVERYNEDDCASTLHLRNWLETLRAQRIAAGDRISRPVLEEGEPPENLDERQRRIRDLMARLLEDVPPDREHRSDEEQGKWLLAHMLDWHRREEKAPWWEYFRLSSLDAEELVSERSGVGLLELVGSVGGSEKHPIHRYTFPAQDTDIEDGDPIHDLGGNPIGSTASIDPQARTIDIKKREDALHLHPEGVFTHTVVTAREQAASLFRLGRWVAEHGMGAPGPRQAARDLLTRASPRLRNASEGSLQARDETAVQAARRLALELDGGVLPIQGPPGAGKTYTGARMILDLVQAGKRVGVTAVSHKVIRNLLAATVAAAAEQDYGIRCLQKVAGTPARDRGQPIREVATNKSVYSAVKGRGTQVIGGTAWLWAREEMFDTVDVLFVDEAGQMSLANVVAVAQAAKNVVLLGDPQQLDQPIQGSHPEGTAVSALQHLLGEHQTIEPDRGLFLGETFRLHPSICAFTSELFYESRLASRPGLDGQAILGETAFADAGLWFVPVRHEGNQNCSLEEVDKVVELHTALTGGAVRWRDLGGDEKPLTKEDVLIVAPYNAQVGALGERLPNARIGTVDKFQGQEAPIVIYSMATSSPEEAPRGLEFIFSLNRLNVATSRARCACILVASPTLFEPECRTPRQMKLANAFCRYLELANVCP